MTNAQKISTLWITVMINMAFADILGFMYPEALKQIMTGVVDGVTITPMFLLIAAVFVEIGIVMIFATRWLGRRAARMANLIAAPIVILFIIGGGSLTPHYFFFAGIEVLTLIWIMLIALKWRD